MRVTRYLIHVVAALAAGSLLVPLVIELLRTGNITLPARPEADTLTTLGALLVLFLVSTMFASALIGALAVKLYDPDA